MKKRGFWKAAALGMALAMAVQGTSFAAEIALTEPAQETQTETETVNEIEKYADTGYETRFYVLEEAEEDVEEIIESEDETEKERKLEARALTEEELKQDKSQDDSEDEKKELPEKGILIFQEKDYWAVPEENLLEETEKESEQKVGAFSETESETEHEKKVTPITFTEDQEDQLREAAKIFEETTVIINGAVLKDRLFLKDMEQVKTVLFMDEESEEKLLEALSEIDYEKEYEAYQKKVEEAEKETETENIKEAVLPGITLSGTASVNQTEADQSIQNGTTGAGLETMPGNSLSGTSLNPGTTPSGSTTAQKKTITITQKMDADVPLMAGDKEMILLYDINCPQNVKISEGSFEITFDSTKMDYDQEYDPLGIDLLEAFEAATNDDEDVTSTATVSGGKVIINFRSKTNTPINLNGTMLDINFLLKTKANVGDTYNVSMRVLNLKDGTVDMAADSQNYEVQVINNSLTAMAGEEEQSESQTESQSQTQPQSQTQTQSQSQTQKETLKAAKTGDFMKPEFWICLGVSALGILTIIARRKKVYQKC